MIKYSYCIDAMLEAVNKGILAKGKWEEEGSPCIYVQYSTPITEGDFVVHEFELKEFEEHDIDISNEDKLVSIFEDMLKCENYVENVFLSKEV